MSLKKGLLFGLLFFTSLKLYAQFEGIKDSIVQIYGVVMIKDSLSAIPGVDVYIKNTHRRTTSNDQGIFSIVAQKGDTLQFKHTSFKTHEVTVPTYLTTNLYSMVEFLSYDTINMPVAIIKPRPSREEFERAFLAFNDVNTLNQIAMHNASAANLALLNSVLVPNDKSQTITHSLTDGHQPYNTGGISLGGLRSLFKKKKKPAAKK